MGCLGMWDLGMLDGGYIDMDRYGRLRGLRSVIPDYNMTDWLIEISGPYTTLTYPPSLPSLPYSISSSHLRPPPPLYTICIPTPMLPLYTDHPFLDMFSFFFLSPLIILLLSFLPVRLPVYLFVSLCLLILYFGRSLSFPFLFSGALVCVYSRS